MVAHLCSGLWTTPWKGYEASLVLVSLTPEILPNPKDPFPRPKSGATAPCAAPVRAPTTTRMCSGSMNETQSALWMCTNSGWKSKHRFQELPSWWELNILTNTQTCKHMGNSWHADMQNGDHGLHTHEHTGLRPLHMTGFPESEADALSTLIFLRCT
jgi:hypothetical protein